MRLAIGAVPPQGDESVAAFVQPDAAGVVGEVRPSAGGECGDEGRRAAGGRNPDEIRDDQLGVDLVVEDRALRTGCPGRDDSRARRGVHDVVVVRRLRRQLLGPTTRRGHAPDVAAVFVPRHIGDVLAIGRPDRRMFTIGGRGQALRGTRRQVHRIQPIERRKHEPLAIWRRARATNLPHGQHGIVDRVVEAHQLTDHLVDHGGKWNRRLLAGRNVEPPDLAMVREHDRFRVGRPRVSRQQVARTARFDIITLDLVGDPPFVAGRQLAHLEARDGHLARRIGQPLAVGADGGTETGAEVERARGEPSSLAVVQDDLRRAQHLVVAGRAGARAGVDVATVGRDVGTHEVGRRRAATSPTGRGRRLPGQPQSAATLAVIQPEIVAARDHDVLPVGCPVGRDERLVCAARERPKVLSVGIDEIKVLAAGAIADEHDRLAIG